MVMCMCVCGTSTFSLIAQKSFLFHGVGVALWQGLVNVQCRKSPKLVTTTADVLNVLGLKEEAAQLRGWLVCQALVVK